MNEKTVGEKLRVLRGDKPREEVANAVDISVSALQMYENDRRTPRDPIKVRLAKFYNVTVEELFFNQKQHDSCGCNKRKPA
ncbi:helix-turn-helix domain-containing protein [Brevibacillus brevis]|uniref:helix-turn-helix transcriptional regulator n=1 Tax=Brevibacillus brevis TaxID=1393 RepID=UPI00165E10CC|nr:helix-turn-helix transcriptional regulator [Brevibacillus brevis]